MNGTRPTHKALDGISLSFVAMDLWGDLDPPVNSHADTYKVHARRLRGGLDSTNAFLF